MPDDPLPPAPDAPRGPRVYLEESVEHRLKAPADLIVAFGVNARLREGLATVKVTQATMDALAALLASARTAYDTQAALQRAKGEASARRDGKMVAAETAYAEVFNRAKPAKRTDAALRAALDVGRRASSRTKRLEQMGRFLNAAELHAAALGAYGVEEAHLLEARTTLGAAATAYQTWGRLDIEAQQSTDARDKRAMKPLDEKMRDIQERGKAAFGDDPQMLEFLGLRPQ